MSTLCTWSEKYERWMTTYEKTFKAQELNLGSEQFPFPDRVGTLQGTLLACQVALQIEVPVVEYSGSDTVAYQ